MGATIRELALSVLAMTLAAVVVFCLAAAIFATRNVPATDLPAWGFGLFDPKNGERAWEVKFSKHVDGWHTCYVAQTCGKPGCQAASISCSLP